MENKTYVIISDYENGVSCWVRYSLADAKELVKILLEEENIEELTNISSRTVNRFNRMLKNDLVSEAHELWLKEQAASEESYIDTIRIYDVTANNDSFECGGSIVKEF